MREIRQNALLVFCHAELFCCRFYRYYCVYVVVVVFIRYDMSFVLTEIETTQRDERERAAWELEVKTAKSIGNRISYDTKNFYQIVTFCVYAY